MLERLKRFLGFAEPQRRPYRDLSDREIVERYARGQAHLEATEWNARSREIFRECEDLMIEWEWRHDDLTGLEERAKEVDPDQDGDEDWLEW